MKKLIIYLSAIVVLFGGLYALNIAANGSKDNPYGIRESKLTGATRALLDDPNYQNIILPDELESKLNSKHSGFVYFFKSDCTHCLATTPHLKPMVDELGIDMPMYNLMEFTQGWAKYDLEFTPTLVYFKDGKKVDELVGGMEMIEGDGGWTKQEYLDFLNKYKK